MGQTQGWRKGFWLQPAAIVGPMDRDALPSAAETAAELARLRDLGGAATHSEVAQFVAAECRMVQYALAEALEELDRAKRLTATMYLRLLAEYGLRLSWLCGEDEVVDELGRLLADPELVNCSSPRAEAPRSRPVGPRLRCNPSGRSGGHPGRRATGHGI